jgi:predicted ATP-grasp superfamily ATP-dependent carboligase
VGDQLENLLIIGIDTVSIASSARKMGYKIYAVDYFNDMDLRRVCSACESVSAYESGETFKQKASNFNPRTLLKMVKSLSAENELDVALLSSGLDDDPAVLQELHSLVPILGNDPNVIENVRKKPEFFGELRSLGIAYPETAIATSIDEADVAASQMGYPIVIQTAKGFGGMGVNIMKNSEELEDTHSAAFLTDQTFLVQKLIEGVHSSISFLADGKNVEVLTLNEQLLGLHFMSNQEPFKYCGNTVPFRFSRSTYEQCLNIAEKITKRFGLKGSNGIDLVVPERGEPCVIEVNPRFQGTLECVERVLGINLVRCHIDACLNSCLPSIKRQTLGFCTRLILYAPVNITSPDLSIFRETRNIPIPRSLIKKGEPICSIVAGGKSRNISLQKTKRIAQSIYLSLPPF